MEVRVVKVIMFDGEVWMLVFLLFKTKMCIILAIVVAVIFSSMFQLLCHELRKDPKPYNTFMCYFFLWMRTLECLVVRKPANVTQVVNDKHLSLCGQSSQAVYYVSQREKLELSFRKSSTIIWICYGLKFLYYIWIYMNPWEPLLMARVALHNFLQFSFTCSSEHS